MENTLTEAQYEALAQFWREYMMLGPAREFIGLDRAGIARNFCEWMKSDENDPRYGLLEIEAFFDEKERRDGIPFGADFL